MKNGARIITEHSGHLRLWINAFMEEAFQSSEESPDKL